jgi:hypothetical protein
MSLHLLRQLVTNYHALHRITYMAERKIYYQKIWKAVSQPEEYMSIIIYGMAQTHTVLPWCANQKDFPSKLKMHLLGIIEHGQFFVNYCIVNYFILILVLHIIIF